MKAKKNYLFVCFCLLLLTGLVSVYHRSQEVLSPLKEYQHRLHQVQSQIEREKLKTALLETRLFDFQTEVAELLPEYQNKNGAASAKVRNVASVVMPPVEGVDLSGVLFERAKDEFKKGEYGTSAHSWQSLISKYPQSPWSVTAHFYLGESYYKSGQLQECLDVADTMVQQFPHHELTGFLLLRMGQILATRNRAAEAKEIFRTVAKEFKDQMELRKQARILEESI